MKKIIMFDIDNTLLDHYKHEIPSSTISALKSLITNDNLVGIASGKYPRYIKEFLKPYNINIDTYVAFNGNYVEYKNKVIYDNPLPEVIVKRFEEFCLKNNIPFVAATYDGIVSEYHDNEMINSYYNVFSNSVYPKYVEHLDYKKIYQLSVMIKEEDEKKIIPKFKELTFVRMNPYGMNVLLNDGLKEKGIQKILDYAHLNKNNLIAFGDGLNDIGMLKLAHIGVALGNADDELKKYASYVTSHISDNGIYHACKYLKLI
ncbi:MAG: Cof-type HAD-IIB family hydrolase [Bacilli bacterium]|jgi:Cof subfamily protein (haloacid dehalogenase superfamily)|nr:Cof-type HAD-IIB family hydrolase [Bacilli bacterium]